MTSNITTSQTIGPFSHEAWRWAVDATANLNSTAPTITVSGVIFDGDGAPINDAMLEAWLPDAVASETAQAIPGFRRVASDDAGAFRFELSQAAPALAGQPVAYVTVFARGLGKHQFTAIILEDDATLAQSAILNQVPAERRNTLIARPLGNGQYQWNVWMQSDKETVFFDYT